MIRTPEEQYLHELIDSYVEPLRNEIEELRKELNELKTNNNSNIVIPKIPERTSNRKLKEGCEPAKPKSFNDK
jgi:hypothetical protein